LTNRELARLQSFPDWFRFSGPEKGGGTTRGEITSQAEQIGNAVPPRLMKAIGTHVQSLLESTA
jgi:DNA (cytosine-5)-methyltransferase 1